MANSADARQARECCAACHCGAGLTGRNMSARFTICPKRPAASEMPREARHKRRPGDIVGLFVAREKLEDPVFQSGQTEFCRLRYGHHCHHPCL